MRLDYIYDYETYRNIFTAYFIHADSNNEWFFEISDWRNDWQQFCFFITELKNLNARGVGFNNIGFDNIITDFIYNGNNTTAYQIYEKKNQIFQEGNFKHMIWPNQWLFDQLDLYKIHHFDNKARSTSLKALEFAMLSSNIKDLPFEPDHYLTENDRNTLITYNKHDVLETKKFYFKSKNQIALRKVLTEKYNHDFTNYNDTKIGKEFFIMKLEFAGIPCYENGNTGSKKPRQTHRPYINLNDVIFNYVQFQCLPFKLVLQFFRAKTITETKGVFHNIECSHEQVYFTNPELVKVFGLNEFYVKQITDDKIRRKVLTALKKNSGIWLSDIVSYINYEDLQHCKFQLVHLHAVLNNFQYDFGTGGIHGSVSSQIVRADQYYMIKDIDVKSFYPDIAIQNRIYPEHLGEEFCDIYAEVFNQRVQTVKKSPENMMLKLALNGVYGDSNNVYSPFYDPAYTMTVTINGQLMLCMLAEQLETIEGLTMIQINTDGLTVKVPRQYEHYVNQVCEWWQQVTKLTLEFEDYKAMYIRDVNNYIGEFEDGKLKRKGAYAHNRDDINELPWHKDHSALIIPKAAEAVLVRGENLEQFIKNHSNFYDFLLRAKVPRTSKLVGVYNSVEYRLENIQRYYITYDGLELIKLMPPLAAKPDQWRRIGINVGWQVAPCNDLNEISQPINYDYYIQEAAKLIQPLINGTSN